MIACDEAWLLSERCNINETNNKYHLQAVICTASRVNGEPLASTLHGLLVDLVCLSPKCNA
eukprot:5233175-Amphidinium_carterae.1